jgi:hypothetical protein
MSVDGTPISQADLARIEAEDQMHAEQQRRAARVIAAAAHDVGDCRILLSVLGLGTDVVRAARRDLAAQRDTSATVSTAPGVVAKRPRKRRAAA